MSCKLSYLNIASISNNRNILWICLTLMGVKGTAQEYNFRNFDSGDGLAQNYIYSILQDAKGYLWAGTGNGLSRYDGFGFRNYTVDDSLSENFISCGIRDGDTLWFGHRNGSLSVYNGKEFRSLSIPGEIRDRITDFARSPSGKIWAGTDSQGFLELSTSGLVIHPWRAGQPAIVSFEFLDDTELLVGTSTALLHCRTIGSGEIEIVDTVDGITGSGINCIRAMNNGSGFYIATANQGIFQLKRDTRPLNLIPVTGKNLSGLSNIREMFEDSQSNLWIGTFGSGLIRIPSPVEGQNTGISVFDKNSGYPSNNVETIFEDREGIIWCGNYGEGLTQITPRTLSSVFLDADAYGNNIFTIFCYRNLQWIGTGRGLVKRDRLGGEILEFYNIADGLPEDTITSVYSPDGRDLWIGTERNGVFRLDTVNGKFENVPISSGTLENSITMITGEGETVWIGTKKGLCRVNTVTDGTNWYTLSNGGLPHNFIQCLYLDKSGRLWLSTPSNTLAYIQEGKVNKILLQSTGRIISLGPIAEDADSRIWIGTRGNGVLLVESDSVISITEKEGLLSDYCYSLIWDRQNYMWVGHRGGLSRIRLDDLQVKPIINIENTVEEYSFNPNAVSRDPDGRIWFGSDRGLVSYDPSLEYGRFLPPVAGITSLWINNEEREIEDKLVLPPGSYKIRIEYLGISLKEPSLVSYSHMLKGYEEIPEITGNTSVTYNHITEGDYSFVLNSVSGDGAQTETPVILEIMVKTPLWKKWWFYSAIAVAVGLLLFGYIKRREYKLREENRILEEKVRERTAEIEKQKNEIELQKNLIDDKNANITSSITYASYIQQAVLPPLNMFDRLLSDNFIIHRPKDIVSGDFYWITKKAGKIIFTISDCTGHGVPGAFMSLLGITLLNEIVNIEGILQSDKILTQLSQRLVYSLQQGREKAGTMDGMDMALCVLDRKLKKIQFTGSINDLIYIRDGELNRVRGDFLSIGYTYNASIRFTVKEITYQKGDVFYLYSDGFQDQFGGEHDTKYKAPNFQTTLKSIHKLPMVEQKEILEKELEDWMENSEQTDDITVLGIRF